MRKATNIRRGEIPVQKRYGIGIPSEIYNSKNHYSKTIVNQERQKKVTSSKKGGILKNKGRTRYN